MISIKVTSDLFQALWSDALHRGFLGQDQNYGAWGVTFRGTDHGQAYIVGRQEVAGLGLVITVYEEGSTHWVGLGMQRAYDGASLRSLLVERVSDDTWAYVQLSEVPVRTNKDERQSTSTAHWSYLRATTKVAS